MIPSSLFGAIGGEILQVCFDAMPESGDEDHRDAPYVLISRNFEVIGPATIEWHDGSDYNGGAKIVSVKLTRDWVLIKLRRNMEIDISFGIGDRRFARLTTYLRRMLNDRDLVAS